MCSSARSYENLVYVKVVSTDITYWWSIYNWLWNNGGNKICQQGHSILSLHNQCLFLPDFAAKSMWRCKKLIFLFLLLFFHLLVFISRFIFIFVLWIKDGLYWNPRAPSIPQNQISHFISPWTVKDTCGQYIARKGGLVSALPITFVIQMTTKQRQGK